jgi:hypothetical protein
MAQKESDETKKDEEKKTEKETNGKKKDEPEELVFRLLKPLTAERGGSEFEE